MRGRVGLNRKGILQSVTKKAREYRQDGQERKRRKTNRQYNLYQKQDITCFSQNNMLYCKGTGQFVAREVKSCAKITVCRVPLKRCLR